MSDLFSPIAGLIGGLGGAGIGAIVDSNIARDNMSAQADVLDWQKKMQKIAWQRENNAVQRRANDLRAAGLSPVLAAGSGAQSSAPIRLEAPQNKFEMGNRIGQGFETAQNIMIQKNQVEIAAEQARKLRLENDYLERTLDPRAQSKQLEYDSMMQDYLFKSAKNPKELYGIDLTNAGKDLEVRLQAALQPTKIQQAISDLEGTNLRNALTKVDAELRKEQLVGQKFENFIKDIEGRLKSMDWAGKKAFFANNLVLEYAAKFTALQALTAEKQKLVNDLSNVHGDRLKSATNLIPSFLK